MLECRTETSKRIVLLKLVKARYFIETKWPEISETLSILKVIEKTPTPNTRQEFSTRDFRGISLFTHISSRSTRLHTSQFRVNHARLNCQLSQILKPRSSYMLAMTQRPLPRLMRFLITRFVDQGRQYLPAVTFN